MSNVAVCLFGNYGYDRAAQGLCGAGRKLAEAMGGKLEAFVVGPADGIAEELRKVADAVVVADQGELAEYQPEVALQALTELCREAGPRAVLLGNDFYSQELVPRLAHRLGGSSISDAADLKVEGDAIDALRSAYGGKADAVFSLKLQPAVISVRARSFAPAEPTGAEADVRQANLELDGSPAIKIVERQQAEQEGVRLEDAQVIVAGGRGLGGAEPFEDLQKLADAMGAQMAASRAACDAGWVPPNWQVGQTGKKVAPELYLAIAISGASQHLLGMGDSKVIAAVNTDPDAPIFKHCQFGIVEDYKNVVPLLTEKIASGK